ncbi:hypothetical protein BJX61DRAFT_352930 [Aspergillus egyptiacus]|nr:hypothetical protein BJX61DRAFT_352930 [Aspergillus egyptiacus]
MGMALSNHGWIPLLPIPSFTLGLSRPHPSRGRRNNILIYDPNRRPDPSPSSISIDLQYTCPTYHHGTIKSPFLSFRSIPVNYHPHSQFASSTTAILSPVLV